MQTRNCDFASEHFQLLAEARERFGVELLAVDRRVGKFRAPITAPSVTVIFDDENKGGPCKFDGKSLKRLIKSSASISIVVADPRERDYAHAIIAALVTGRPGMIVETLPAHADAWERLLNEVGARDGVSLVPAE